MSDKNGALDWNDTIEKDTSFQVLPEGDYDFTVVNLQRGRHENTQSKIPPCPKAILTLRVGNDFIGYNDIDKHLLLHDKLVGLIADFFRSIGQKRHGEKLQMNWGSVIGSKGRCKVKIREFTRKNGEKSQSNEIEFLDPPKTEEAPKPW